MKTCLLWRTHLLALAEMGTKLLFPDQTCCIGDLQDRNMQAIKLGIDTSWGTFVIPNDPDASGSSLRELTLLSCVRLLRCSIAEPDWEAQQGQNGQPHIGLLLQLIGEVTTRSFPFEKVLRSLYLIVWQYYYLKTELQCWNRSKVTKDEWDYKLVQRQSFRLIRVFSS